MLIHSFRIGLFNVKQNRALGGRGLAFCGPPRALWLVLVDFVLFIEAAVAAAPRAVAQAVLNPLSLVLEVVPSPEFCVLLLLVGDVGPCPDRPALGPAWSGNPCFTPERTQ